MNFISNARYILIGVKVLQENFDKHSILESEQEKSEKRSLILPMVILGCFGIEVALKALIARQGKKPPNIHDLKDLYAKLSRNTKIRLKENFNKHLRFAGDRSDDFKDLEKFISNNRKGFEFWRYPWDNKPGQTRLIDPGMILAVLWVIIFTHEELYPNEVTDVDSSEPDSVSRFIENEINKYKKGGV